MRENQFPSKFDFRPFHCEVAPDGDVVRVRPFGELDMATAPQMAGPLGEVSTDGHREVVLDLAGVTFIDSSGMRAIVEARQAAARSGVEFTVLPGPRPVQRAFEVAGLDTLLFS